MTAYQWIVYGQRMADLHDTLTGGTMIDIYGSMKPITVVTITGKDAAECRRVFNLFAESWRHDGLKVVYDDGRCLDSLLQAERN